MPPHTEAQPPANVHPISSAFERSFNAASPSHQCGLHGCTHQRGCGLASSSILASRTKTAKRKAAEALLAARYSTATQQQIEQKAAKLAAGAQLQQHSKRSRGSPPSSTEDQLAPTRIPACRAPHADMSPDASTSSTAAAAASSHNGCSGTTGWCDFEVWVPSDKQIDWKLVINHKLTDKHVFRPAPGLTKVWLAEGLLSYVVESPAAAAEAIRALRHSMKDRVVAIDLEWRPDKKQDPGKPASFSKVAMLQLATSTVSVLFRFKPASKYEMPAALREFLEAPDIVLLGFSWDTADEAKMQHTFGWGKARFKHFLDLQQVAGSLGYTRLGLGRLTQLALKVHLPKVKHWSTSNWEAPTLHLNQILYAALDVLVAGQVFRALRTLHKYSDACAKCKQVQGHVHEPPLVFVCSEPGCGKAYSDYMAYTNHCAMQQHAIEWQVCIECGLIGKLPANK